VFGSLLEGASKRGQREGILHLREVFGDVFGSLLKGFFGTKDGT